MKRSTKSPLHAARKRARIPAEVLAERVGISVSWLRSVEVAPGLASEALLERLALALGESPASLTGPRIVAGKVP